MDSIDDRIIDYLRRNRVSTTEVADCLGKTGVLPEVMPCTPGYYRAGKVNWVYACHESNWTLHNQIQNLEDGRIVFVDAYRCGDRALFGQLVSKYILLYHQSEAVVVQGKMRDAAALIREKWPIWCRGYSPVGCYNEKPQKDVDPIWIEEHRRRYEGAIAVCDDCGVVVIPPHCVNEEFLEKLHFIEEQEDIWFDRLDHYKESTFDIVCRKDYLRDETYMSARNRKSAS